MPMTTQYPNIDIGASTLRVTYLELRQAPSQGALQDQPERIAREQLNRETYLHLYRRVGAPLQWDKRLLMPERELSNLLAGGSTRARFGSLAVGRGVERDLEIHPSRIWLHTDTWDHPAAVKVYERAGFRIYDVRDEAV